MEANSIQTVYENLEKKLNDEEWVKQQEPEFINLLRQLSNLTQNLSAQVYIFIDLFQQYIAAMYQSPLFSDGTAQSDDSTGTSPTQTSAPMPANREQRRAKEKQDKKLLVPEKKLIVP